MPSDFTQGRPGPPKTLADLIAQLTEQEQGPRPPFMSSPTARPPGPSRFRGSKKGQDQADQRKRVAKQALKRLRK